VPEASPVGAASRREGRFPGVAQEWGDPKTALLFSVVAPGV